MYQYCTTCKTETYHFITGGTVNCRCGKQTKTYVGEVTKSKDTNSKEVRRELRNSDVGNAKTDRQGTSDTIRDSMGSARSIVTGKHRS